MDNRAKANYRFQSEHLTDHPMMHWHVRISEQKAEALKWFRARCHMKQRTTAGQAEPAHEGGQVHGVEPGSRGCSTVTTAAANANTFSIKTGALRSGESRVSRRLNAQGALTETGGKLAFAAVSCLIEVGVRHITMDLAQLTSVTDPGLYWLHQAWLQTNAVGGCLRIVGLAEPYDRSLTTRPFHLIDVQRHRRLTNNDAAPGPGQALV